jgi:hypothetical protein
MDWTYLIDKMQLASIVLVIFVCTWGFFEFRKCLWDILMGRYVDPRRQTLCPYHASGAVVCIAGIVYALARANTLGFLPAGHDVAGLAFIAGCIALSMAVGFTIWAKDAFAHHATLLGVPGHPALSRIFSLMLIIILCFVLVGLVRAAFP